jgi:hypothetical protein
MFLISIGSVICPFDVTFTTSVIISPYEVRNSYLINVSLKTNRAPVTDWIRYAK